MEKQGKLARELLKRGERRIVILLDDILEQRFAVELHERGHLRRLHVVGAGALGLANELGREIDIGDDRTARAQLHEPGAKLFQLRHRFLGHPNSAPS